MGRFKDLIGMRFGKLIVVGRAENYISPKGRKVSRWKCICDCGNPEEIIVNGNCLINGYTKSCGCLQKERAAVCCKQYKKKYNDYEIQEDYVIMYTSKDEPFLVDLEDFWKVRDICWHKNRKGYLVGLKDGVELRLHRFIMDCPDNMMVDHIGGFETKNDNRKTNLRIANNEENCHNQKIRKNNTSGCTGITWNKRLQKWQVSIGFNNKVIFLGIYNNFDDAVKVRKEAEEKYFGEWSYDSSQKYYSQITF